MNAGEDERHSAVPNRAQSNAVAVVLMLGIMITGAAAVVTLGATAINDTEDRLSVDRAEQTLTQLDSKAGLVALGEARSQRIPLPAETGDEFTVDGDAGTLRVKLENRTDGSTPSWADPLVEVTLGTLEFDNGGARLGYQGGGVFRAAGGNGTLVSPPEFHYRNGTLTLPIVNITGDGLAGNTATVTQTGERRLFPLGSDANRTNPLDDHKVILTVQSEYYQGWGQYFEQRTDGGVEYNHSAQRVQLTLVTPIGTQTYENAITTTAGDFDIQGKGNSDKDDPTIDAYNSSAGTYATRAETADLSVTGAVDFGGNPYIYGNVTAESFTCKGSAEVTGAIRYVRSFNAGGNCDVGSNEQISAVPTTPSIAPFVSENLDSLADEQTPGTELTAGTYYNDTVSGITKVNTTDGDVTLGVEDLTIDNPITVEGEHDFTVFVNDSVDISASLTTADTHNATITTIYGASDFDATVSAELVGTVYAPDMTSTITVEDHVYGAAVAGQVIIENGDGGRVHFDTALEDERTIPEDASVVSITYLHITENGIDIS
ncbi:hypothetical protein SAMN05216226_102118 [Halovenus aranensis]|uniref:DUF7305 domain-containing protein n=1 Tax=Halovenus aranensis TaxID=890420 RepID=A0A1G8ST50_9EURY|nr:hypothetical protein [Halovenus aranensis]SDJ31945.1 hypothetical protein SAMN05216226_102118 [Halovenus aranensis]